MSSEKTASRPEVFVGVFARARARASSGSLEIRVYGFIIRVCGSS